jgi:hypothetical protein
MVGRIYAVENQIAGWKSAGNTHIVFIPDTAFSYYRPNGCLPDEKPFAQYG